MRRITGWTLALLLVGCGDVAYEEGSEEAQCEDTAGGEEGTPDELSELMAEVIAPRICDQAIGSFVGLPGDESHDGAAGGRDASVGRWWIRNCEAHVVDGRLRVAFGGPGWTWLDRESMGFRVRQYLRFDAAATFTASLHVGYDRRERVASVWLRPEPGVHATVEPRGLVRAEATGVFSSMLGGILDMTGNSADDQARTQATEEGSSRLQERLQTGFTVTFELDTEQLDFMLGQLPRGVVPLRPWEPDGTPWIVNERSAVWPGGVDVLGPIPDDAGAVRVDVELEEGDGAIVRRVCAEDLHEWLDAAWAGSNPRPLHGAPIAELQSTHAPTTANLSALDCSALLVVTPRAGTTNPSMLRYRVITQEAREAHATGPTIVDPDPGTDPGTASGSGSIRIEIRSVTVNGQDADGAAWDMFNGDPDPYVVVTSIPRGRELHRTDAVDDQREASFDQWLPSAVSLDDLPIRLVVYDEDVAGDSVIGAADLERSRVTSTTTDLTLDLRSQGSNPRRTGSIRVRIQPGR